MRTLIRGVALASILALGVLGLEACQRQQGAPTEATQNSASAEREAILAAEQLAALGEQANAQQRALYEGEFQASGGIEALDSGEGEVGAGEGAWELRLYQDYVQFARPGLGEDGGLPGERDYRERGMRVVAGPVIVTISQQTCSASGVELPYVAHVIYEGVSYQGCARRGVAEGDRPTWALVLSDLLPAIDVCLARTRSARVTQATEIEDARVSVRLRGRDGTRVECVATASGQIDVFEPLADSDRRPGEGDPEFQRGGDAPAAQTCRSVEEAIDREGQPMGWLIRRTC